MNLNDVERLEPLEELFEVVSRPGALRILKMAGSGIDDSSPPKGLTLKEHRATIRILLEAGLLRENEGGYRTTLSGQLVYTIVIKLLRDLEKPKEERGGLGQN